jgi:hypothetical protein
MHARQFLIHPLVVTFAAVCFCAQGAWAAESTFPAEPGLSAGQPGQSVQPAQSSAPSVNNEAFKTLRNQCEKDVPSGKASGDICVEAAAILLSTDLPDEFREFKEDQRIKIALRLLERGVDSSNLARARAFDYYDRIGFLGLSTFSDSYRAKELMDMMVQSGYAGATLRKIRSQTQILSFGATEAEKRAGCTEAKKILASGKLDADSTGIARDIVGSGVCTGYDQVPK